MDLSGERYVFEEPISQVYLNLLVLPRPVLF